MADDIVWGQFRFDGEETLRNVRTGQSIRCKGSDGNARDFFDYDDGEIAVPFHTYPYKQEGYGGKPGPAGVATDLNHPDLHLVRGSYGLWRRLAHFLPEALTVWHYRKQGRFSPMNHVALGGGWQNGRWHRRFFIETRVDPTSDAKPGMAELDDPIELFPLDGPPGDWRYVEVPTIAPETKLALMVGSDTPILDQSISIETQLAQSPHFIDSRSNAAVFHRSVEIHFWREEDYSPKPHYGFVDNDVAFTILTSPHYGIENLATPARARPNGPALNGFFKDWTGDYFATPTARLWQRIMFALIDVQGAAVDALEAGMQFPIIPDRDQEFLKNYYGKKFPKEVASWKGIDFGRYLHKLGRMPMMSPFGPVDVRFGRPR